MLIVKYILTQLNLNPLGLKTNKAKNIRMIVRQQFEINKDCADPEKLEDLKGS